MNPAIKIVISSLAALFNTILAFRRYRNVNIVKSLCFFFETKHAPFSSNKRLLHLTGDYLIHKMCQNDASEEYWFINEISFNKM